MILRDSAHDLGVKLSPRVCSHNSLRPSISPVDDFYNISIISTLSCSKCKVQSWLYKSRYAW